MKKKHLRIVVDLCLDDIAAEYFNPDGTIYKIDNEDIHCNDDCLNCSCAKFCETLSNSGNFYKNYKKISKYLFKRANEKAERMKNEY